MNAFVRRLDSDKEVTSFFFDFMPGKTGDFIRRFGMTGFSVESPPMPGAYDVIPFHPAPPQRSTFVIALSGHRAKLAVLKDERNTSIPGHNLLKLLTL